MAEIDSKILLGIVGLITTVYGWLFKHLFGKVQFKDVCAAKHKGLEDCIEAEEKRNTERYEALDKKIDAGFKELKQLVRNNGRR
jgi:hypothetical protein